MFSRMVWLSAIGEVGRIACHRDNDSFTVNVTMCKGRYNSSGLEYNLMLFMLLKSCLELNFATPQKFGHHR